MYGMGYGGNDSNGTSGSNGATSARFEGQSVTSPRSDEAKAAKSFVGMMNSYTFNPAVFAISVVNYGGRMLRPRIMQTVEAIVGAMANLYDCGEVDNDTANAKRYLDAINLYRH